MTLPRFLRSGRISILMMLIMLLLLPSLPSSPARAQTGTGGFASAVPCLNGDLDLATTCFADTIYTPVVANDPALVRVTVGGVKQMLAPIGTTNGGYNRRIANNSGIGSVYGLAYDDGAISGIRRLFAAAFTRRFTSYGPLGPGGVYEYRFNDGQWRPSFTVPNAGLDRPTNDRDDTHILAAVGKSGLGDMEISPDGTTLFIVNLNTRQLERYDITGETPQRLSPIPIPFQHISANQQTVANLRPFALEFAPGLDPITRSPRLMVGVTDTVPSDGKPQVFVLEWHMLQNSWQVVLHQPLITYFFNERFAVSTYLDTLKQLKPENKITGWNPWNENLAKLPIYRKFQTILDAQPFLTDIEFSADGQFLRLGLRDRIGDLTFFGKPPVGHYNATAQGDSLNYRRNSDGQWILEVFSTYRFDQVHIRNPTYKMKANPSDWLNDHLHGFPGDRAAHVENHMGSLLAIPNQNGTETIVATSLLGDNASGLMLYTSNQPHPFRAITLIPPGSNKSTSLGDLELLCTYAFVSGQLWHDVNGNGVRETGEPPLAGVKVEILEPERTVPLGSVITATDGSYTVAVPPNRALYLRVAPSEFLAGRPLAGMVYSPINAGADDTRDSDAHPIFGVVEFAGRHTGNGVTGRALPLPLRSERVQHVDIGLTRQFQPATIGDLVWHDVNRNGVQDPHEPGIVGIPIRIERVSGSAPTVNVYPRTTVSDAQGRYSFTNLEPGQYRVVVSLPEGYAFAPSGRGGDAQRDSDIDEQSGFSPPLAIDRGMIRSDIDVGLTSLQPQMDLSVELRAPTEVVVGDEFRYTISYRHTGLVTATNVVIRMILPTEMRLLDSSRPVTQQGSVLTWQLGRVHPNSTGTIDVRVRAPTTIGRSLSRMVDTTATISANPPDTNQTNNSTTQFTRLTRAELSVSKSAPATVLSGDHLLYTLQVVNRGSAAAANVVVSDPLPPQLDFVSILRAPGGACRYEGADRTLRCNLGSLAPGQEVTIGLQTRPRIGVIDRFDNRVTVTTTTAGDEPSDNVATVSTLYLHPNPAVTLAFVPAPAAAGELSTLQVSYRNHGNGIARNATLTVELPTTTSLTNYPTFCQRDGSQLVCALGDLAPATDNQLRLELAVPAPINADQLSATATITTTTPEIPIYQQDNQASATVVIVRPNPFVQLHAPSSIIGQGSVFAYTIEYGNLYRRRPAQTRAAENTVLELELPADVQLVGASLPPSTQHGQRLRWDLATLAPQTAARIEVVVQTKVPAGTVLPAMARVTTTTPGDDPVDNIASLSIQVVPPPTTIGTATGDLRVAIRSTLDPATRDASQTNGVYLSDGSHIAWPSGEVLDLTPQIGSLTFADEPLPWPYTYQMRVVGWSLVAVEVGGQRFDPRTSDSRGVGGCRPGARPSLTPQLLSGCVYRYLGGQNRDQLSAGALRERDLDDQVHLYWSRPPLPSMRSDVYLYATEVLEKVRLHIQVELEVQIVNQAPGSIGGVPLPPIPVAPLPDPARQIISGQIHVTLLAPRSLVAPGS